MMKKVDVTSINKLRKHSAIALISDMFCCYLRAIHHSNLALPYPVLDRRYLRLPSISFIS